MFKKKYYWDSVSGRIAKIFKRIFEKEMSILEIGFAGGHFLEWLNDHGYEKLSGIEIRREQYNKTLKSFHEKKLSIELINDDIINHIKQYDAIYSTGLIQCLNEESRIKFLEHVSKISNLAVYVVPEILRDRNIDSTQDIAVAGCKEYITGNIPFELSQFYDVIHVGRISKTITHVGDDFIYYICKKNNIH